MISSLESFHAIPPPPNTLINSINSMTRNNSRNSLIIPIVNSVYNVSWVLAGKLNLTIHELQMVSHKLGIVKIVLVLSSIYNEVNDEAQ
jgi:hypothetical protein